PARKAVRMRRLETTGPSLESVRPLKYTSRTRSDTCEAWTHQSRASPSVYAAEGSRRNDRAPRAARACRNARRLARYWAFVCVQGVVNPVPLISLSPIRGVAHPV